MAFVALGVMPARGQTLVAGPDSHGYSAYTFPAYLRDVSLTGSFVSLGDDDVSGPIALPFTFTFYGVAMNSVQISSNGFLRFPPEDYVSWCCNGEPLPFPGAFGNVTAGYWTDLNLPQGNIRYQTIGVAPNRQFVVGFYDVPHYYDGPRVTFEIILHEGTNAIEFQYGHTPSDHWHTQTVGIQNLDGTSALQLAHGQIDYHNQGFYMTTGSAPGISAGPDGFGYAAYGVGPHLRDVSSTGTFVSLGDDHVSGPIALPFTFSFYGVPMNSVQISSNGFLRFPPEDYDSWCCNGEPLPIPGWWGAFGNVTAGYWTDLNLPQGNIRYGTVGTAPHRRFVVGFYNVPHYYDGPRVTFEIILHEETNSIEFQYGNSPSDHRHTQTVGIQNLDASSALQIAHGQLDFYNTGFLIAGFEGTPNQLPTADAGEDETVEATSPSGADFVLDGTGSTDPDGPVTHEWSGPFGTVSGATPTITLAPPPAGQQSITYEITLTVTDSEEATATDTVHLTVTDTTGPEIFGNPGNLSIEADTLGGANVDFGPLTATDIVDGDQLVACSSAPGFFPLGATPVTCSASDLHTNSSGTSFTVTVVDTTPPTVTCGTADGLWHATDVGIACTASDIVGLANPADAAFTLMTSVPGGTETASAFTGSRNVCDASGNCTLAGPIGGNMVDKLAPSIAVACTPAPNGSGWYNTNVTATFVAADGGSGVAGAASTVVVFSAEGANQGATQAFADNVGNSSSASTALACGSINIDKTPPSAFNQFDPQTRNVLVFGRDGLSGVPSGPIAPVSVAPARWSMGRGAGTDDDGDSDDDRDSDGDSDRPNAELRTYVITDAAGNTLTIVELVQKSGNQSKVRVVSHQYNDGPVVPFGRNLKHFEWSVARRTGALTSLEQELSVGRGRDRQRAHAVWDPRKNRTTITVHSGAEDHDGGGGGTTKVVKPGLVFLRMVIVDGQLVIEY